MHVTPRNTQDLSAPGLPAYSDGDGLQMAMASMAVLVWVSAGMRAGRPGGAAAEEVGGARRPQPWGGRGVYSSILLRLYASTSCRLGLYLY